MKFLILENFGFLKKLGKIDHYYLLLLIILPINDTLILPINDTLTF